MDLDRYLQRWWAASLDILNEAKTKEPVPEVVQLPCANPQKFSDLMSDVPYDLVHMMRLYGGFEAWDLLHDEDRTPAEGDLKLVPRHESNFALRLGVSTYWKEYKDINPPSLFPLFVMDERSMIAGGPFPISTVCVDVNPSNATFGFVSKIWGNPKSTPHYSAVHHFRQPLEEFVQLYRQWKRLQSRPTHEVKLKLFADYLDQQWKH